MAIAPSTRVKWETASRLAPTLVGGHRYAHVGVHDDDDNDDDVRRNCLVKSPEY